MKRASPIILSEPKRQRKPTHVFCPNEIWSLILHNVRILQMMELYEQEIVVFFAAIHKGKVVDRFITFQFLPCTIIENIFDDFLAKHWTPVMKVEGQTQKTPIESLQKQIVVRSKAYGNWDYDSCSWVTVENNIRPIKVSPENENYDLFEHKIC